MSKKLLCFSIISLMMFAFGCGKDKKIPVTPSGVAVSGITATTLTISWNPVPDATGYHVFRSLSQTGVYTNVSGDVIGSTSYLDQALTTGTTYWYKVSAYNEKGDSPQSAEVSGVPTAGGGGGTGVSTSYTLDLTLDFSSGNISPYGIDIDSNDQIWVADGYNGKIWRIDPNTGIASTMIANGSTDSTVQNAYAIYIEKATDTVYISDTYNYKVSVAPTHRLKPVASYSG